MPAVGQNQPGDAWVVDPGEQIDAVLGRRERIVGGMYDQYRHARVSKLVVHRFAVVRHQAQEIIPFLDAPGQTNALSLVLRGDQTAQAAAGLRMVFAFHAGLHDRLNTVVDRVAEITARRVQRVHQIFPARNGREGDHPRLVAPPLGIGHLNAVDGRRNGRIVGGPTFIPCGQQCDVGAPAVADQARAAHVGTRLEPVRHLHQVVRLQDAEGVHDLGIAALSLAAATDFEREHVEPRVAKVEGKVAGALDPVVAEKTGEDDDAVGIENAAVLAGETQSAGESEGFASTDRKGNPNIVEAGPGRGRRIDVELRAGALGGITNAVEVAEKRANTGLANSEPLVDVNDIS